MDVNSEYNVATIRDFLVAAFTTSELRRLCQENPAFREVLDRCARDCAVEEMADHIIEFCEKRILFRDLFRWAEAKNPRQYARFLTVLESADYLSVEGTLETVVSARVVQSVSSPHLQASLAHILQRLSASDAQLTTLESLAPPDLPKGDLGTGMVLGVVTVLQHLFDPLKGKMSDLLKQRPIRLNSETASYFLRSLAEYVNQGSPLVSNWDRDGAGSARAWQVLDSGAQFLFAMECKRRDHATHALPIRELQVVIGIIKARLEGKAEPVFLMRFDGEAGEYQFIGGVVRPGDTNYDAAMKQELLEEIPPVNQIKPQEYVLDALTTVEVNRISRTSGVYTKYCIHVYHVTVNRNSLILFPMDRWITLPEIKNGTFSMGGHEYPITADGLIGSLGSRYPGGLEELPFSFKEEILE